MEQAYYYRHSPWGGRHWRLAEHEAAASRVTYLTGMWRPVNRPCKAGKIIRFAAEGPRKGSLGAQIPRCLRLAVRAAVSRATNDILPPAITAARGEKAVFSRSNQPRVSQRQDSI